MHIRTCEKSVLKSGSDWKAISHEVGKSAIPNNAFTKKLLKGSNSRELKSSVIFQGNFVKVLGPQVDLLKEKESFMFSAGKG